MEDDEEGAIRCTIEINERRIRMKDNKYEIKYDEI